MTDGLSLVRAISRCFSQYSQECNQEDNRLKKRNSKSELVLINVKGLSDESLSC